MPRRLLVVALAALPACLGVPASSVADTEAAPELGATTEADADEVATDAPVEAEADAIEPSEGLTGDWDGTRMWLAEQGLAFDLSITTGVADVVSGGLRQRSTTQALFLATADADLDRLLGWPRATAELSWLTRPGRTLNDDVGDWQGTDWIDSPHRHEVYQVWLELWPITDSLRVKLGKLEGFDDFGVVESAAEFLNNGPAYSPTLDTMPSYPDSAFGVLASVYPSEGTWLSLGAYDGAAQQGVKTGTHGADTFLGSPSDLFLIGETGRSWTRDESHLAGRAALGTWEHTGDFARFDGGTQEGARGTYALVEQELWAAAPETADDARGITFFAQAGRTDADVMDVVRHIAAGLRWQGPFEGRDEDVLGLGASRVGFSHQSGAGFTDDGELALETYYRWQAAPWLVVQPDLQFVRDPGGDHSITDAVVATLRFEITL